MEVWSRNSHCQVDAIVSSFKNSNTHELILLMQGIARVVFFLQFKMEHMPAELIIM